MSELWFRHNERGFGPGLPIHRNGWIVLGSYLVILVSFPWLLEAWLGYDPRSYQRFLFMVLVTIPFGYVAWRRTEGGWGRRAARSEDKSDPSSREF
jgi:hypothetical protein